MDSRSGAGKRSAGLAQGSRRPPLETGAVKDRKPRGAKFPDPSRTGQELLSFHRSCILAAYILPFGLWPMAWAMYRSSPLALHQVVTRGCKALRDDATQQ